jgi:hypothetical protein
MWDSYLLPEDVAPADARLVLEFLNQAASAQEIADAVEFTRELDIGLRIAQRILNQRAALGSFTTLQQVYAVPMIGPERFTEIVVSLSNARPPRAFDSTGGAVAAQIQDIRGSIEALRNVLLPTAVVRLWSLQEVAWLGQPITLLGHVTDTQGRPLVDRAVTLTANWGELVGRTGLELSKGASLQMRTDDLGMIKAQLVPRLDTPIRSIQQQSLEAQLSRLPIAALTPGQAAQSLAELAALYRADGSNQLRAAIDAYYQQFGTSIVDADSRGVELASWPIAPGTVQCYVHSAEMPARGTVTIGFGIHTVRVRNWIGAFLQVFARELARDTRMTTAIGSLRRDAAFAATALRRVRAFVKLERGAVGNALLSKTAEDALNDFVQAELRTFPRELQRGVLHDVKNASSMLGTGGVFVFEAVQRNSSDLRAELPKVSVTLDSLTNRLATLEQEALKSSDLTNIRDGLLNDSNIRTEALRADLMGQLARKADAAALNETRLRLDREVRRIDTDVSRLRP